MKRFLLPAALVLASVIPSASFPTTASAASMTAPSEQSHRNSGNGRGNSGNSGGNHRNSGNQHSSRPGGNSSNRPGNNASRPGGNKPNNNKPNSGNRPNNGNHGSSAPRPGSAGKPGGNASSAPRPGSHATPPTAHKPTPGHHHGGFAPLPPPPPRPVRLVHSRPIPTPSILGLALGSLFDFGVRSLISTGYNVVSYVDNVVNLSNVAQAGVVWPEATFFYGSRGLDSARFSYTTGAPETFTYDTAFARLSQLYGAPESFSKVGWSQSATWWSSNMATYVTLSFSPATTPNGVQLYVTNLVYGR